MDAPDRPLQRLGTVLALMLLGLALVSGYWAVVEAPALTARTDNPRPVLNEARIDRGAIVAADGTPLAVSANSGGSFDRLYPVPAAAPVLGYNSVNYGQTGIELAYDSLLRGDIDVDPLARWWQQTVLGIPQAGYDVRLTIDPALQQRAFEALGGARGAVVVIEAQTGRILVLVSSPSYDPAALDDDWETLIADPRAPLLNRATQASYRLDDAFLPVYQAAVARTERERPDGGSLFGVARDLGLIGDPLLPLEVLVPDEQVARNSLSSPTVLRGAGGGTLTVTPLNLAWTMAAVANGGLRPGLQLVDAVEQPGGTWTAPVGATSPRSALSQASAAHVDAWLAAQDSAPPAGLVGIPATALQLPDRESLGWWLGYTADHALAVVVALEGGTGDDAKALAARVLDRR